MKDAVKQWAAQFAPVMGAAMLDRLTVLILMIGLWGLFFLKHVAPQLIRAWTLSRLADNPDCRVIETPAGRIEKDRPQADVHKQNKPKPPSATARASPSGQKKRTGS